MVTNNFYLSSLPSIHHIVQNSMVLYPKELVIATLRNFFSNDDEYHYVHDHWGYPQTPSQLNLPQGAGLHDNSTTRLFIAEAFVFDKIYTPSLIVRHGGATSVPVSFNMESETVHWGDMVFQDGYGNVKTFKTPKFFAFQGGWEGSINIDVIARDLRSRDDLVDLVSLLFVNIAFQDLEKAGLVVKSGGVSAGAPFEIDDRNDKLFKQTVTLQIRTQWDRFIPIGNVIDFLNFAIQFQKLDPPPPGPVARNLTINTELNLLEILAEL